MRGFGLVVLFFVSLVVAAIAMFPLSQALNLMGAKSKGLAYERAYGTIWSGALDQANYIGQPLGRVSFASRPLSLLSGALSVDFRISGQTADGRGQARFGMGGVEIANTTADVNVQNINNLDARLRQSPSTLNISIKSLKLSYAGACRGGRSDIRTDLLTSVGRQWRWQGPAMTGELVCVDERPSFDMRNEGGADQITAQMTLNDRGGYLAQAEVRTQNSDVIQALRALGFESRGGAFVYEKQSGGVSQAAARPAGRVEEINYED
ncbi:MAG: hypothetical protein CME88_17130 [Hirschia sp.]|nr:hypothetical protein [Hirschia sp.]